MDSPNTAPRRKRGKREQGEQERSEEGMVDEILSPAFSSKSAVMQYTTQAAVPTAVPYTRVYRTAILQTRLVVCGRARARDTLAPWLLQVRPGLIRDP